MSASMISWGEKKEQVIATVKNFTNPFIGKSNNLFNLTTKGVMLSKIKKIYFGRE